MVPVWIRPWLLGACLCYSIFAIYWYLFVGYADGWDWQPQQRLAADQLVEPVDWDSLEATPAGQDLLLSVVSKGRDSEVEACRDDGACRRQCQADNTVETGPAHPVLNCLVSPPPAEENDSQARVRALMREDRAQRLGYVLRAHDGQLAAVARLQGEIKAMRCDSRGQCYLLAELPDIEDNVVFVSGDFGHHWHLAAQSVLDRAYVPKIIGVDGQRVWVAGYQQLYVSKDGGQHWRVLVDDQTLIAHDASVIASSGDRDLFDWYLDDANQIHAVTGGTYGRDEDTGVFRLNADTGEILSAKRYGGRFVSLTNGPGGGLFGVYRTRSPQRYTLYRLHGEQWRPVLQTGSGRLGRLWGNAGTLIVEKGRGDGSHLLLSRDAGQHWRPMDEIDALGHLRLGPIEPAWLQIGYRDREQRYGYRWIRAGD
ncbi:hypothetical protein [Salinisphaera sp. Q1T1-3]|uniref:hypothetical protein n=1 Tax=Salinisphaera sp. Q1T1-3 TaxID=2321229 RepID=UPI000E720686|nr:hypothetical protein [Salinisphaera sp. Q1T1-3]RJS93607.1 hypothetical protein D3260_07985 [Salinisphaera sp. Q1T1-3]